MRKFVKEELLACIDSLKQSHKEISAAINKNETSAVQNMLSECQEFAVSLGDIIEQNEGERHMPIPLLEEYCEVLFYVYEHVAESSISAKEAQTKLDTQIDKVRKSIISDIPVRKEVVFFPYKASMWDSLESVYLKYKEDESVDAYCVPIPYYDRTADGGFGEMHYEGNQYPQNIEIIDWQKYDYVTRKPDEIYIHNPYDEYNYVTSVHPLFYSEKLKQYTEKLVYIPYFVLAEVDPNNQAAVDGMKHFITVNALIFADEVIVQSENMKKVYVQEYIKWAKELGLKGHHIDIQYQNERIKGTGSPKFDKVARTKKEDLDVPKEWLDIIKKPDGSWKKIIFYNTSITALLASDGEMLEKMVDVFKVFFEHRDNVALLWRPHPLIPSTLKSMRPQLWEDYQRIVETYKSEGWGIYDDSADMDRAVILSDAYYGDQSSIVQLYKETKKPIMIQNALIRSEES